MQKKSIKLQKSRSFTEAENKFTSFAPVNRNGWWIKFSTNKDNNILLVFTSMFTGQTIIRFFQEEDDAVQFINYLTEQNPAEKLTL
jgi:hypothetical protein